MSRSAVVLLVAALAPPVAIASPGRPPNPPPPPLSGAPSPAWVETGRRSLWLAYGSFCWKATCADLIPPQTRPGLPVILVQRHQTLRVHLDFAARTATVSIGGQKQPSMLDRTRRIVSWRATRAGILTVFVRASGDASYVARLRLE